MPDEIRDIETLESRIVYRNAWMTVREDAIRRRDGSPGIYGVVEKADFVVVVPAHADGSLQLVQQSGVAYELRTTWHPRWLPEPALLMLADWLASHGVQRWVLQAGRPPGGGPAAALAASWREALKARVPQLSFR